MSADPMDKLNKDLVTIDNNNVKVIDDIDYRMLKLDTYNNDNSFVKEITNMIYVDDTKTKMERLEYKNNLMQIWTYYKNYFKLCVIVGKKANYCKESIGGAFNKANDEEQINRFCKAISDYEKFGYCFMEYFDKETKQIKLYKSFNKDTNKFNKPNIAVITGEMNNIVVIDIDNKNGENGKNGIVQFNELLIKYNGGYPIDTFTVQTGSGGYHVYFKYDEHTKVLTNKPKYNRSAIDVKSNGGYVVCPGSTHPVTNNKYIQYNSLPVNVIPAWLFNWLMTGNGDTTPNLVVINYPQGMLIPKEREDEYDDDGYIINHEVIHVPNCETCENAVDISILKEAIDNLNDERADDYNEWAKVIWAIKSSGGSLELAKEFSSRSNKYNEKGTEARYEVGVNSLSFGSILHWLKEDKGDQWVEEFKKKNRLGKYSPI